jgi:hypothetical protein
LDNELFCRTLEAYTAEVEARLTLLQSGKLAYGERSFGSGWQDVTQDVIHRDRNLVATFRAIINQLKSSA